MCHRNYRRALVTFADQLHAVHVQCGNITLRSVGPVHQPVSLNRGRKLTERCSSTGQAGLKLAAALQAERCSSTGQAGLKLAAALQAARKEERKKGRKEGRKEGAIACTSRSHLVPIAKACWLKQLRLRLHAHVHLCCA